MFAIGNWAKIEMFAKSPFLFAKSAIFGKHVCNSIRFFYAFLNIMGYVSGRIPDQRSYKRKNSGPSKKLDFTLFFASVKGFEPPAFRLGGERSIQLSYTDKSCRHNRRHGYFNIHSVKKQLFDERSFPPFPPFPAFCK